MKVEAGIRDAVWIVCYLIAVMTFSTLVAGGLVALFAWVVVSLLRLGGIS